MYKRAKNNNTFQAKKKFKQFDGNRVTRGGGDDDDDAGDLDILPKEACMKPNDVDNRTDFRKILTDKPDGKDRPFYVLPNGRIFVEAFLPMYQQAEDFLVSIAEPVSRQRYCHQYQITAYSLYAGASMGIATEKIIEILDKFCKTNIPDEIVDFITRCTTSYGKLNVVLRNSRYFLESSSREILRNLMEDREIQTCLMAASNGLANQKMYNLDKESENVRKEQDEFSDIYKNLDDDDDDDVVYKNPNNGQVLASLEVADHKLEHLQKRCMALGFNPLAEYDFRHDVANSDININLKPHAVLRPYQEKSLRRMFGSGRARSGVIVLPCGAGKTLTGVAATCTINKKCLILCTSSVAVEQWKNQFKYWSDADDDKVCRFTKDAKDNPRGSSILISTYSMITHSSKRSREAEEVMNWIRQIEWGLMILDEVQFAPAKIFRKVISDVHAHCKLGLTATLVREDDKISDLNFLIGPKLYEANWLQLQDKGYIARVQCCEVACRMDPLFYKEYLKATSSVQQNLFVMNPEKFRICQFLIEYHEKRKDKIIVFADKLFSLKTYALAFQKPFLCGSVPMQERMDVLNAFKKSETLNTIFVSKVADNSFDLPDANVLIQISNVAGSRRQEAQRLGRILRAKKDLNNGECNAFFYSLVSQDTTETYFAHKRQRFLVQQGYSYKFINKLPGMEDEDLVLSTEQEKKELLIKILEATEASLMEDDDAGHKAASTAKTSETNPSSSSNHQQKNSEGNSLIVRQTSVATTNKSSHQSTTTKPQQNVHPKNPNIANIASTQMKRPETDKKPKEKEKKNDQRHKLFKMFR